MVMQIRGTLNPNTPPTGLAERQLSVEMSSSPPKLWCGVPASVDVSERVQLSPPVDYISNALLATALGDFLPLVGGTLSGPGNLTLDGGTFRFADATGDLFTINASTNWLNITSPRSTPPGRGIYLGSAGNFVSQNPALFQSTLTISGGGLDVIDGITVRSGSVSTWDGGLALQGSGEVSITRRAPVTAPNWTLADIWVRGWPGVDNTPTISQIFLQPGSLPSSGIRFLSTQIWERDVTVNYVPDPPVITSDIRKLGSEIAFFVTRNDEGTSYRAMTLQQDGTLRLSSDNPTVVWDKTGGNLWQWELRTGEMINPIRTIWGLHDGAGWRFQVRREIGPPAAYSFHIFDSLYTMSFLSVATYISCGGCHIQGNDISATTYHGQGIGLNRSSDDPLAGPGISMQRGRATGDTQSGDVIGNLLFHSREQGGGSTLTSAIRAIATENHGVGIAGSELRFLTTQNGSGAASLAMTLGEDANLTVVGTVTASGTLLTSDPNLKDDIVQAPSGALAKVCELPVIDFRWKHGRDSKLHRGFSADDVGRVMGEDSGCSAEHAYSLADMNAVLWQAVQELSAQVQELERRIH